MSKPKTITFTPDEPITVDGETYETLTFARMRVRHMVAMDKVKGEMRQTVALFASMADVPMKVIDELDMDEFERLSEELVPIMGNSARSMMDKARAEAEAEAEDPPVH